MIAAALLLLPTLVVGYVASRLYLTARRNESAAAFQKALRIAAESACDDLRAERNWLRLLLAVTEAQRDMHATALRGELQRQARAELIAPDAEVGEAKVYQFPAVSS